ncbi:MAG TPA: hypothetical protein VM029_22360 [Opitutaceae bacterium]|nr:hypothetical protein [Opitutaceae bacterium]
MKLPSIPVAILVASVAANVAAVTAFVIRPALAPAALRSFFDREPDNAGKTASRATSSNTSASRRPAVPQSPALWSALATDDLPTLIARLRQAGFPASVIRAIVSAQIQKRFAERMNALVRTVESTPYWQPAPMSSFNNPKFFEERQQIYRDRARMLRELLGPDSFAYAADPTAAQRRQYGELPKFKIDQVERINEDYAEMTSQVRAATQGIMLPEDREKLALLESEKRKDLAAILTPAELADYEMRTSPITMRMRGALTLMDATEAEFRALYQAAQPFAAILYPTDRMSYMGSDIMQQRREAQTRVEAQIRTALGEARANEYFRASNSEYQQLVQIAQRENLPVSAATQAYDLRMSTTQESSRIGNDTSLSNEQKRSALQTLAQNTRMQMTAALGPQAGPAYAQSAQWLRMIENGSIVTVDNAGSMSIRQLPPPGASAPNATPPRN